MKRKFYQLQVRGYTFTLLDWLTLVFGVGNLSVGVAGYIQGVEPAGWAIPLVVGLMLMVLLVVTVKVELRKRR